MCWKVPITIATKGNPEAVKCVLEKMEDIVTVEGVGPEDYILVRGWVGGRAWRWTSLIIQHCTAIAGEPWSPWVLPCVLLQ